MLSKGLLDICIDAPRSVLAGDSSQGEDAELITVLRERDSELRPERGIYIPHQPLHHHPGLGYIAEKELGRIYQPQDGKVLGAVFRD